MIMPNVTLNDLKNQIRYLIDQLDKAIAQQGTDVAELIKAKAIAVSFLDQLNDLLDEARQTLWKYTQTLLRVRNDVQIFQNSMPQTLGRSANGAALIVNMAAFLRYPANVYPSDGGFREQTQKLWKSLDDILDELRSQEDLYQKAKTTRDEIYGLGLAMGNNDLIRNTCHYLQAKNDMDQSIKNLEELKARIDQVIKAIEVAKQVAEAISGFLNLFRIFFA